jgi:magnesium chelatase subunit H
LKELSELIGSYQSQKGQRSGGADRQRDRRDGAGLQPGSRRGLPEIDASELSGDDRSNLVGKIYIKLMEIESRLLPCGLHVIGKPPTAEEAIATLVNIAGLDREEEGIKSLQRVIAESIGRDIDEIYGNSDRGVLDDVQLLYDINQGVRMPSGPWSTSRWTPKAACPWCLA